MDDDGDGDGDSDGDDACAAATEINVLCVEEGGDEEVKDDGVCGWSE